MFWRNPHVRFWITDVDGKSWELETNALGEMDRYGITDDLFVEGQVGHPGPGAGGDGDGVWGVLEQGCQLGTVAVRAAVGEQIGLVEGVEPWDVPGPQLIQHLRCQMPLKLT